MKPILSKPLAAISTAAIVFAILLSLAPSSALAQDRPATPGQRETPGQAFDDATITAKVKAELVKDDTVKARQVNVTTFEGVVQLSGYVSTEEEKERAETAAMSVTGVRAVENSITVKD